MLIMIPINKRKVGVCILLYLITFGIYGIYWKYLLVKNIRAIKGDNSSCVGEMLLFIFLPYYSLYWWYTRGRAVKTAFAEAGYSAAGNNIVYMVLAIFDFEIVALAIMQHDFNSLPPEYALERGSSLAINPKTVAYILKRVLLAVFTVWIVITLTFFVMHAVPGGPFVGEKATTPAVQAAMEAKYGLDKPIIEQYGTYLKDIVTKFDFGPSLKQRGRTVVAIIFDGMKTSAKLGVIAAALSTVLGIILGSVAALRRNKLIDRIIMVLTTAFVSMPSFIMGSILLVILAVKFPIFPANGSTAKGLILPIITLALYPAAYITRLTRSSMLDVLGQDYIRTAKAKGVSGAKIIFGHALKNSLIPVLTYVGPMLAYIVTGSLVVEQIFAVPGIGKAFVNSITGRDYPMIMGTTIILATLIVIMNLLTDILYKVVDPRISFD